MKFVALRRILAQEDLNFLLTNRIPRIALTRLMGRLSKIRSPLWTRMAVAVWRWFDDLDLSDARESRFDSLHAVFTRALREGARPVDPRSQVLASPCDAILGACGHIDGDTLLQAKGMPYTLQALLGPTQDWRPFEGGQYLTLRLTSTMYHRFHAPHDARVRHVTYISGDTWNVNPIALARVRALFCRNERAVIRMRLDAAPAHELAIVPVAAVLVASIRLHFLDVLLHLRWGGPTEMPCDVPVRKGQELGWFEHGSTLVVLAPPGFTLAPGLASGDRLRAGQALMVMPD
ncbi:MAG: hypothetical protein RI884_2534 [Pseudomonadota bacterium]|jgi:phosphatidylserine decarboxylase